MKALEASLHADGSIEISNGCGRVRLTGKLNRPEQLVARLILSLWARTK
jgi:hypothetical protein